MKSTDFEKWYQDNKSYYRVKCNGNEEAMRIAAKASFETILQVEREPQGMRVKKAKKKKPNPYGFDR